MKIGHNFGFGNNMNNQVNQSNICNLVCSRVETGIPGVCHAVHTNRHVPCRLLSCNDGEGVLRSNSSRVRPYGCKLIRHTSVSVHEKVENGTTHKI